MLSLSKHSSVFGIGKSGLSISHLRVETKLASICMSAYEERTMANLKYEKEITGLLVIDPYNEFISEGASMRSLKDCCRMK